MRPAWKRLVLIAGQPRGGTTWLGAVLSRAAEAHYIFEPQLVERHPRTAWSDEVEAWNRLPRWHLAADESLERFRTALVGHLGELVRSYFDRDAVDTLLIKIPEIERLPWLLRHLAVDRALYVERHPLGILNSFDKARIYWAVRRRWQPMLRDVGERWPELSAAIEEAGDSDLERAVAMIHVRARLLGEIAAEHPGYRCVYEELAARPLVEFRRIFDWLGWRWSDEVAERLEPLFRPASDQRGFFAVEKESRKRIDAWRRELTPWQIRHAADLLARMGAGCDLPGSGLPELSALEKLAGVRSFVERRARRAYRRLLPRRRER